MKPDIKPVTLKVDIEDGIDDAKIVPSLVEDTEPHLMAEVSRAEKEQYVSPAWADLMAEVLAQRAEKEEVDTPAWAANERLNHVKGIAVDALTDIAKLKVFPTHEVNTITLLKAVRLAENALTKIVGKNAWGGS